ncbi:ABC-F family ATP-binding cassette domain-containing protein [Novosphingobium aquimarinum]|uniref:ABC-F family ATP-binding cassette domain-containing protein n=1 Tax=Novosphingobium aquimarinum TaxID=2682494 RepID=UPI0012EC49A7|nr:ABC-F family ATP-binding cassette domain-containing protein [Novosphingobium aquimarinum]
MTLLTLDRVSCATPDGTRLFSDLTFALGREILGLVGRNGSGKSTLLRAIAGEYPLAAGTITTQARVASLRQLPRAADATVGDALECADALAVIARIEAGEARADDLDRADWSLPARLEAAFAAAGFAEVAPDRPLATLSGGERTRLMLAGMLLGEPDVLLLDEPTNNLDAEGRAAVAQLLASWPGGAIVASHDRALLADVDAIIELTQTGVHRIGGGWALFAERRDAEREAAQRDVEKGRQGLAQARRESQQAREKQARRDARGRQAGTRGGEPKILFGARKRQAEATAGRVRGQGDAVVSEAQAELAAVRERIEVLDPVRLDLPSCGLAMNHVLIEARGIVCRRDARQLFGPLDIVVRGPQRIALTGRNGAGKTSLVRILLGLEPPAHGEVRCDRDRSALLDQNLTLLDGTATVLDAIRRLAPGLDAHAAHAALAAAGFRNTWAERDPASLSGGERMRLALAGLFARPQPPQLLVLDEPSNHLDLASLELLEMALADYDGAILCVSHDPAFRARLRLTETIAL